jgi:hypothetical protein
MSRTAPAVRSHPGITSALLVLVITGGGMAAMAGPTGAARVTVRVTAPAARHAPVIYVSSGRAGTVTPMSRPWAAA